MQINPGMLIFALLDSGIAFLLVFFVTRSKFGGAKSTLARTLGAILGTLVFIFYFAAIVWFNTERHTISDAGKMVVYAAPIVLSVLMTALTLLSQPPKKKEDDEKTDGQSEETEENEKASGEEQ